MNLSNQNGKYLRLDLIYIKIKKMCARACVGGGGLCPLKRIVSSSLVLYSYLQNDPNESSCGITDTFLATQGEKQKKKRGQLGISLHLCCDGSGAGDGGSDDDSVTASQISVEESSISGNQSKQDRKQNIGHSRRALLKWH